MTSATQMIRQKFAVKPPTNRKCDACRDPLDDDEEALCVGCEPQTCFSCGGAYILASGTGDDDGFCRRCYLLGQSPCAKCGSHDIQLVHEDVSDGRQHVPEGTRYCKGCRLLETPSFFARRTGVDL